MKLRTVESSVLDELFKFSVYQRASRKSRNMEFHADRRKFLKFVSMIGIGASFTGLPNLLTPEKASGVCVAYKGDTLCDATTWYHHYYEQQLQVQHETLLKADSKGLKLNKSSLKLHEPSSGVLTLINSDYKPSSGNLSLTIADSKSLDEVEDQKTTSYTLPPRSVQTVAFNDGPSGQYPGNKQFTAWTEKSSKSVPLIILP